jgi:hypothetical protein
MIFVCSKYLFHNKNLEYKIANETCLPPLMQEKKCA